MSELTCTCCGASPAQMHDDDCLVRLAGEINCRIEHGAESNGHLEYVMPKLIKGMALAVINAAPAQAERIKALEEGLKRLVDASYRTGEEAYGGFGDGPTPWEAARALLEKP